jgi:hypothetical protein
MNKFKTLLFLVLIATCTVGFSQTKTDAFNDAQTTAKAAKDLNSETVIKHTLPSVIDMMGGKDAALKVFKATFDNLKTQSFIHEKAEINSVTEIVKEQDQFRCVVEVYNQMTMSGQRISSKSYLLGIYNETDKYWWFVETKQLKNEALVNQVLPGFETKIVIPEDEMNVEIIGE